MTKIVAAWVSHNWMYAGLVAAIFLLALTPILASQWTSALVLVYVQLPAYMLHQVEEHAGDRFRRFVNEEIGHGRDVLTTAAVVVINVPVVWGIYLADIYLARFVALGLGLIGTYAMLLNAVIHIVAAIAQRRANPGLFTAAALFLPLGAGSLVAIVRDGASIGDHVFGLAMAVLLHAAIIVHMKRWAPMAPAYRA